MTQYYVNIENFIDAEDTEDGEAILTFTVSKFENAYFHTVRTEATFKELLEIYGRNEDQIIICINPFLKGHGLEAVQFDAYECGDADDKFFMFKFWEFDQKKRTWIYTDKKYTSFEECLKDYPLDKFVWYQT